MRKNPENWGFVHKDHGPNPGAFEHHPLDFFLGINVLLGFPTDLPPEAPQTEWMWVFVEGGAQTQGYELFGRLNQDPVYAPWHDGERLEFNRNEIAKIYLQEERRTNPISESKTAFIMKWLRRRLTKLRKLPDFDYYVSLFPDIDRIDPSPTGKYFQWILDQIIRKKLIVPDDYQKYNELLQDFLRIKNRIPVEYRNIQNYDDFTQLYNVVTSYLPRTQSNAELAESGTELVYEDDFYRIFELTTPEAAVAASKNTGWCTCNRNTAITYLEQSPLSIVYKNMGNSWDKHLLIHPASKEINHPDNSVYEDFDPHFIEIIIDYFPTMYCNVHGRLQNLECYSCNEKGCCDHIKCQIDGCGTYMCTAPGCHQICKTCETSLCGDHIAEECHLCGAGGNLCSECADTCNSCDAPYCADHKSDCAICDQGFCDECFDYCSDCGLLYCSDCGFECEDCQDSSCRNCAERDDIQKCALCSKEICKNCTEQCYGCKQAVCGNCMAEDDTCGQCYEY